MVRNNKTKNQSQNTQTSSKSNKDKKHRKLNIKYLGGMLFGNMARGGARELKTNAEHVNSLNVFPVPDGDTGDNMRMTIESGIAAIESVKSDNLADVMNALSRGMLLGARGNSGVILSQFFAGTAKGLSSNKADPAALGRALKMGVKQAYSSVMTPTEGTILTVAREAVEYAESRITPRSTIRSFFADLVKEMHSSLERTPDLLEALRAAGVVDSGGAGLFYIMDGFYRVLNGEEIDDLSTEREAASRSIAKTAAFDENSEMTFGYCTELLVQLQRSKTDIEKFDIDALRAFLASVGNSVVAFIDGSIVKLHVHTFTPECVIAHLRQYGELLNVKVENMSLQHTDMLKANQQMKNNSSAIHEGARDTRHKHAVVAVAIGEGIEAVFSELMADIIIHGGQGKNPSTEEFLTAFSKLDAENILVLPNNSNIIMAAEQAAHMYKNAHVCVLPTKNVGDGYAALSSYNPEEDSVDEVISAMRQAIEAATSGYVCPAVKDADIDGYKIKKGEIIGVIGKKIVASKKTCLSAAKELASKLLIDDNKSVITIFTGVDAKDADTEKLRDYIEDSHSGTEVYIINGGQQMYPYIMVSE